MGSTHEQMYGSQWVRLVGGRDVVKHLMQQGAPVAQSLNIHSDRDARGDESVNGCVGVKR